jgi:hypothetical protein
MPGSVLSVNVADVREVRRGDSIVKTGIWKLPVDGPVAVRGVNVEGDEQADRSVHGGVHKAVYAYAREDIDWWEAELDQQVPDGVFGENLTLRDVDVTGALIGERWRIGSVLLEVSEPRFPAGSSVSASATQGCSSASRRRAGRAPTCASSRRAASRPVTRSRGSRSRTTTSRSRPSPHAYLSDHSQLPRLLIPEVSEDWQQWVRERAA